MSQIFVFKVDLSAIDGNGDFLCPRCGTPLSPDDNTDEAYSLVETETNNHGLQEATIQCNKCQSHIHLTGFSVLEKIEKYQEKPQECEKEEDDICYFAHV